MAHLVDSSVWVALHMDNDSNHKKAITIFQSLKGDIIVPYCVVNEVSTVLTYKHSKAQADAFLDLLRASSNIVFVNDHLEEEIDAYRLSKSRVSFTDCALTYLARHLCVNLVTFDKQLASLSKKKI